MDRLSSLFVRRLRQMARRAHRHVALECGLVDMTVVQVGRHNIRVYRPVFEVDALTGILDTDVHWMRARFPALLTSDPISRSATGAHAVDGPSIWRGQPDRTSVVDRLDAYAMRVIDASAPDLRASDLTVTLLLARALRADTHNLRDVIDVLRQPAPIVSVTAFVEGFEKSFLRMIETSDLVPFGPYVSASIQYPVAGHVRADLGDQPRRRLLHCAAGDVRRERDAALKRLLGQAVEEGCPIVAVGETEDTIVDRLDAASDLSLHAHGIDSKLIGDLVEFFYGAMGKTLSEPLIERIETAALSLHDLNLAFRPRRPIDHAMSVLARLAAVPGDSDGEDESARSDRKIITESTAQRREASQKATTQQTGSREKRHTKTSGADIIQPVAPGEGADTNGIDILLIEDLAGYGEAKTWALELKDDLVAYRNESVRWADLSTRLLLSGPPGTGKTTFARALCNSLQVPLVATSVSTWLEGGHLDTVLQRMSMTFQEATALAPAIVFVDEIDGIGKRVTSDRDYADYWNAVVNKALELLDGAVKTHGIVVIGATNRPQQIDAALTRSGRLEKHIVIPTPDIDALAGILRHHLKSDLACLANPNPPPVDEDVAGVLAPTPQDDTEEGRG
ncbi:AAA family ATPase [Pararhizobium sp. O133]|uniref:AAA family ATPase n=1 Tax=Pararhizobium sp. O133 TaxID=3449278 RepID=UPI003F6867BC